MNGSDSEESTESTRQVDSRYRHRSRPRPLVAPKASSLNDGAESPVANYDGFSTLLEREQQALYLPLKLWEREQQALHLPSTLLEREQQALRLPIRGVQLHPLQHRSKETVTHNEDEANTEGFQTLLQREQQALTLPSRMPRLSQRHYSNGECGLLAARRPRFLAIAQASRNTRRTRIFFNPCEQGYDGFDFRYAYPKQ